MLLEGGTAMDIRRVDEALIGPFREYCLKHRGGLDASYISDAQLASFDAGPEDPSFVALDRRGAVIGASSIMLDGRARELRRARFRVLHEQSCSADAFKALSDAALASAPCIDSAYLFVPDSNLAAAAALLSLGFKVERHVLMLSRTIAEAPSPGFPPGFLTRPFTPGKDEDAWCRVRNEAFSELTGNAAPITPDMVAGMAAGEDFIEGGMLILEGTDGPAGVIMCTRDEHKGLPVVNIGPLAVLKANRGKGLGRALLLSALKVSSEAGFRKAVLSVNADNAAALALYEREGFTKEEGLVCFGIEARGPSSGSM